MTSVSSVARDVVAKEAESICSSVNGMLKSLSVQLLQSVDEVSLRTCFAEHALQNMLCRTYLAEHALQDMPCRTCLAEHALQDMLCRTCFL